VAKDEAQANHVLLNLNWRFLLDTIACQWAPSRTVQWRENEAAMAPGARASTASVAGSAPNE